MTRTKLLNSLTSGYGQVAGIFPIVVAAPRYFAGKMQLGGLVQTAGAFGQVQGSMSWFIDAYAQLAEWRAIVERLATFHRAIVKARAETHGGFDPSISSDGNLHLNDVIMTLPDGTKLLDGANLTLTPRPLDRPDRTVRHRQDHTVPCAGGHLAVRLRGGANPAAIVLPAAASVRAAGHVAARDQLSECYRFV